MPPTSPQLTLDVNWNGNEAKSSHITEVVDKFGMSLIQELHTKYSTDKAAKLEYVDEEQGITIQVRSLNDCNQVLEFKGSDVYDNRAIIILPEHIISGIDILYSGSNYVTNVLYEKPELIMGAAVKGSINETLNSVIISSTVAPPKSELLPNDSPVKVIFQHLKPVSVFQNLSSFYQYIPTCNFLQVNNVDGSPYVTWNSSGCEVYETNDTYTICHCYHLTSFAVLMRVTEFDLEEVHEKALEIITIIGCSVSLVSLTLTILTFVFLRKFTQERIIHLNLCFSIGLGQATFLAGIGARRNPIACMFVAILLHYFFTSVFCWMLVEGIQLYTKLVRVFDSNIAKRMVIYFFIGWGVPFVIVVTSVSLDHRHYGFNNNCWLAVSSGLIWAFVGPALVIILTNVVFLGMVVRVISRLQNCAEDDKYTKVRASVKAAIVLLPLLGMTWLFGLVSVNRHTIFFEYVFAILNSLQGFFIFVLYCFKSSEVRAQLARKRQTMELTHGHNFSSVSTTVRLTTHNQVHPATTSPFDNTTAGISQ
ncbi:adhesion G-protein coupled receptor D1-like [Glandiceps talaboti]